MLNSLNLKPCRLKAFALCTYLGALYLPVSADPATTSPLHKVKDVVIYSDPTYHCAFPSVVVRPDGEILCAFRRAPSRKLLYGEPHDLHTDPNSYLVLCRSKDNAATWSPVPELIFAHPLGGSQDPCMLQLKDETILCASYGWALVTEKWLADNPKVATQSPYAFLGGYLLKSHDAGKTWSNPIVPPPTSGSVALNALKQPVPSYNRGAMAEAADGSILWAVARQDKLPEHTSVHLMRSHDKGETWSYASPITSDPNITFNETSLVVTRDNTIIAFLRSEATGRHVGMATSSDNGKTFTPWKDLGFHGSPQQALRLPDDRILLVYGYREKPYGVRARLLKADASDAATAPELILRDDGGETDLGYPWAALMKDGRILVAYYINIAGANRHIAGSILEVKD